MARKKEPSDVGFGKPPLHTRFKKGTSGNPRGRPKGSKNLATQFLDEVNAQIPFTENGRRSVTTKLGAAIKQQVTKAASGDARAVEKVLDRVAALEARAAEGGTRSAEFTSADREVIETIFAMLKAHQAKADG